MLLLAELAVASLLSEAVLVTSHYWKKGICTLLIDLHFRLPAKYSNRGNYRATVSIEYMQQYAHTCITDMQAYKGIHIYTSVCILCTDC